MELDLQRFAEGAAADGAAAGAGANAPMATGNENASAQAEDSLPHLQPRRKKENPLAHMKFGIQPEDAQTAEPQQQSTQERASFKEMIKGEYAQEAQAWLNEAMTKRFKAQDEMKQQLQQQQALLDKMARKYAEKAAEAGMPVGAFKQLEQVTEQRDALLAQQEAARQDAALRAHFGKLHAQGLELQKQFPGFNLLQEMQNPQFARMVSPEMGVDVKNAYFAMHAEEIQKQSMEHAGQEAARALASSVRAGAMRPLENGIAGGGAVQAKTDVRSLTRAEREEINRRARAGQRIIF